MVLEHGFHGWTDVGVPDMKAGERFYTELFDWEPIDGDAGEEMPYTMFAVEGKLVAGMGPLPPEHAATGQPPAWSVYVIVDDAEATFARAVELGATPLMEPMRILEAGAMAFILDPVGAPIGFWEAGSHRGAEMFDLPNTLTWNDLGCRDVERAKTFYAELFGWEASPMDMGDADYWTFSTNGHPTGGVWDISGSLPEDVAAHWLTWFRVADCSSTADKVSQLGGTVRREPQDSPIGTTAIVADPFGAVFAIIETDEVDGLPPR